MISSPPIPLRIIPLESTIKNLTGLSQVKYCKKTGMSSIGEMNPDNNTAGIIKVITDKIACCCVLQIAEIYSPTPTIASSEIKIEIINKRKEPENGKWKNKTTIPVITIVRVNAIINGGIDFPSRISNDDKGLTISWSNVPSSLSLAIDNAVRIKVVTRESIATITVKMYHLYSRFGLNQLRTERFIPLLFDDAVSFP